MKKEMKIKFDIRLIFISIVCGDVFGKIYRCKDRGYSAEFSIVRKGRLPSGVVEAIVTEDVNHCMDRCGKHSKCNSVNFNHDGKQCEIIEEESLSTDLVNTGDSEKWYYYGTSNDDFDHFSKYYDHPCVDEWIKTKYTGRKWLEMNKDYRNQRNASGNTDADDEMNTDYRNQKNASGNTDADDDESFCSSLENRDAINAVMTHTFNVSRKECVKLCRREADQDESIEAAKYDRFGEKKCHCLKNVKNIMSYFSTCNITRNNGNSGQNGKNGNSGQNRNNGNSGQNRNNGNSGQKRNNGNSGQNGNNGNSGQNGNNGNSGQNGNNGNSGQNGYNGNSGQNSFVCTLQDGYGLGKESIKHSNLQQNQCITECLKMKRTEPQIDGIMVDNLNKGECFCIKALDKITPSFWKTCIF